MEGSGDASVEMAATPIMGEIIARFSRQMLLGSLDGMPLRPSLLVVTKRGGGRVA